MADKYTDFSDKDSNLANEWWEAFSALPEEKLAIAKGIISHNRFSAGDYECSDPEILNLLAYYTIGR